MIEYIIAVLLTWMALGLSAWAIGSVIGALFFADKCVAWNRILFCVACGPFVWMAMIGVCVDRYKRQVKIKKKLRKILDEE